VTAIAILIDDPPHLGGSALPHLAWTTPSFNLGTLVGLGIPLFIVTMASQNITGMSVLSGFGYRPRLRPLLLSTGATTMAGAPFGAHAVNLAAISAALTAGPDAEPDPARRWIASIGWGLTCLVQGLGAGLATALVATAPPVVIESVAGLALLGSLAAAIVAALADAEHREAATITFVVSASAVAIWNIGAPFWGLVAGLAFGALQRRRGAAAD
jgi:benzoate membrane transport protein